MPLVLPSSEPQPLGAGIYSTDAFHRRPLFVVGGHVISSWNEAFALHGAAKIEDVNPAYVAALITSTRSAQISPYTRIQRMPRASYINVAHDGSIDSIPYDPFAQGAAAMGSNKLQHFLRQCLIENLQVTISGQTGAIGCEHSSGLDSNAILGGLIHGLKVSPKRIYTWSNENGGEGRLLKNFREFYCLEPTQCHRFETVEQVDSYVNQQEQQLKNIGAPAQMGGRIKSLEVLSNVGCKFLFSGFGGDQAISHNGANIPTDLVLERRWHELRQWTGGTRASLKTIIKRVLASRNRSWAMNKVMQQTHDFYANNLLKCALSAEGRQWLGDYLIQRYPWEHDIYVGQHQSIRQRVLNDWVAVRVEEESRLARIYGIKKYYPLLDERLIATLLQQDPLIFGKNIHEGRLIHREAFAPFLPPLLRNNPSKVRESEAEFKRSRQNIIRNQIYSLEQFLSIISEFHPILFKYWDIELIRREVINILTDSNPTLDVALGACQALSTLTTLSLWFNSLDS